MKNLLILFALCCFIFSSCSTSKEGVSYKKNQIPEMSVSSTAPVPQWPVDEPVPDEEVSIPLAEEEPIYASTDVFSETTSSTPRWNLENQAELPAIFREATTHTNSKIAKRILSKAATKMETTTTKSKKGFFSRLSTKLLNKFSGILGINESTADIFAIVSLVTGILSIVTFSGFFILGLAAIVFGFMALKGGTSRKGMAIAGIIMGALSVLLFLLYVIFVILLTAASFSAI